MTTGTVAVSASGDCLVVKAAVGEGPTIGRLLTSTDPPVRARRRGDELVLRWPDAAHLDQVDGANLRWEAQAHRWIQNRRRVQKNASTVRDQVARAQREGAPAARCTLSAFPWIGTLDDHQAVNVAALTVRDSWGGCVFDEQGTGKTLTAIAAYDVLHHGDKADVLFVVAPKSMVGEWPVEVKRFTDNLYRVEIIQGSRREKAAALESGADVLVCNYETVDPMLPNLALLAERARIMLVIDESFFVKNPDSGRSSAVRKLREHCTHAVVLCGTPAPNSPADLVAQFDLVDFGHTFRGIQLDKERTTAARQVASTLETRGVYLRSLKGAVLPNLPSRSFSQVSVEMAPDQAAAYHAALDDLIVDLRDTTDAEYRRTINSYLERRAALLRICSDPSALVPGYSETPTKTTALDQIIIDLVERKEKIVLWSFYRASLDRLADRYEQHGLVRIDGSITKTEARRDAVQQFQDDPEVSIFLGNPAAAGAGLTLHSARYAIYESLSNQAAHFLQSLDRIHRRGQSREVHYITLLCNGTIEELEYSRLLDKADRQADLLGDPPDARPTRTVLLDELTTLLATAQTGR